MKRKKKLFIITGGAVGVLIIAFALIIAMSESVDDDGYPNDGAVSDTIALYNELAETRTGFTGSFIKLVPIDEIEVLIDGVDYSSADVKAAFEGLYEIAEPNSGYTEVRGNSGTAASIDGRTVSGPKIWVDLGGAVIEYIEERQSGLIGGGLYAEWSDPELWIQAGDAIVESITESSGDSAFDSGFWSEVVGGIITEYAAEWDDSVDWDGLGDIVTEYIGGQWSDFDDEDWVEYVTVYEDGVWEDYRENPTAEAYTEAAAKLVSTRGESSLPKAESLPISYKAMGRLFYREILSDKQKLAYDVIVTAIQQGKLGLDCDFGISADEMYTVVSYIKTDFPEFFFIDGYGVGETNEAGNVTGVGFVPDKDVQLIGIDKAITQIAERVKPTVAAANKLSSQIDKVKYITDHICKTVRYFDWLGGDDFDAFNKARSARQSVWSGIITGDTVCAGYAAAVHYYMNLLGIPATRVYSKAHAWNLLELDGEYYYMDVTSVDTPDELVENFGYDYRWFNFNETLLKEYASDGNAELHARSSASAKLPAAHGTKYVYANWFGASAAPAPAAVTAPTEEPDGDADPWSDAPLNATSKYGEPGEPQISTPIEKYPELTDSAEQATVTVNGVDVTSKLKLKDLDGTIYAQAKSFVETIAKAGMSGSMHSYGYELIRDYDAVYSYLSSYEYERGMYIEPEFERFLGYDAILVTSWVTDSALYMMFADVSEAVKFEGDSKAVVVIGEAPRIIDGEVYIPVEAFAKLSGNDITIK